MTTIALVGPDGSGKTTIARRVVEGRPRASRYRYMGVNLETDASVLPTTRLVLELKRRRGGRPDLTARFERAPRTTSLARRTARGIVDGLRLAVWVSEEWYRQALVWNDERVGRLVVMDRHFLCDAIATDAAGPGDRPWPSRLHGAMLRRLYPRPDHVVILDVPVEMLRARRPDDDPGDLERRRTAYLGLLGAMPGTLVVDAAAPLDEVVGRIATLAAGWSRPDEAAGHHTDAASLDSEP
ncbi:MAG TPA: hypothetical protein VLA23_07040 [Candidatus Limnocylindrales bacterium]|nr:hypothetical protein [Candidatus Limnocylindrales bacterium]